MYLHIYVLPDKIKGLGVVRSDPPVPCCATKVEGIGEVIDVHLVAQFGIGALFLKKSN